MKSGILTVVLMLASFGLQSCAFGPGNSLPGLGDRDQKAEQQKQIQENRDFLLQTYQPLKGTYDKSHRDQAGLNVVLGIFWVDVPSGKNSLGEDIFTPKLKLKFRLLEDELRPDIILDASFQANLGTLVAYGSDSRGIINVSGKVSGDQFSGEVTTSTGRLGGFTLNRTSNEVNALSSDQEREFFNFVRTRYQSLKGIYTGTLSATSPLISDYPIVLELDVVELVTKSKADVILKATYRRPDIEDIATYRFMDVAVRLSNSATATELSMSAQGTVPGLLPDSQFLAISGTLNEDMGLFTGKLNDWRGQLGKVILKRKQ